MANCKKCGIEMPDSIITLGEIIKKPSRWYENPESREDIETKIAIEILESGLKPEDKVCSECFYGE